MLEFRCSSLGYDCGWRHIATEESLMDMAVLHLREIHGVQSVRHELETRIRKFFTEPAKTDAAAASHTIIKEYSCNMAPLCTWRYIAMTEDLIIEGAAVHAREQHGIRTFRRELIARVKRSIHAWTGENEQKKRTA